MCNSIVSLVKSLTSSMILCGSWFWQKDIFINALRRHATLFSLGVYSGIVRGFLIFGVTQVLIGWILKASTNDSVASSGRPWRDQAFQNDFCQIISNNIIWNCFFTWHEHIDDLVACCIVWWMQHSATQHFVRQLCLHFIDCERLSCKSCTVSYIDSH